MAYLSIQLGVKGLVYITGSNSSLIVNARTFNYFFPRCGSRLLVLYFVSIQSYSSFINFMYVIMTESIIDWFRSILHRPEDCILLGQRLNHFDFSSNMNHTAFNILHLMLILHVATSHRKSNH